MVIPVSVLLLALLPVRVFALLCWVSTNTDLLGRAVGIVVFTILDVEFFRIMPVDGIVVGGIGGQVVVRGVLEIDAVMGIIEGVVAGEVVPCCVGEVDTVECVRVGLVAGEVVVV